MIEVFDPASGERDRRPVPHLDPTEIRGIQEALVRAGQLGAPTGRLDGPTRKALRRFQGERELEPCGCPSYETLLALGIHPRVVQILLGPAREAGRPVAAPGAASGPDLPEVRIVYGTPPRRPAATDAGAPGGPAVGPGAGAPGPEGFAEPSSPTGRIGDGSFAFHERHLLFPVFVGSPFFPPNLRPVPSDPGVRRGLPLGRRPVVERPIGISTRSPPRR